MRRLELPRPLQLRPLGALAVAVLAGVALLVTGIAAQTSATLVVIGFSPDRGDLITALVIDGLGVALAALVFDGRLSALAGGAIGFVLAYHHTFDDETRAALKASGATGTFDPVGWVLSVVTLAIAIVVIGWSVATLFRIARRQVVAAIGDLRDLRARRDPHLLIRPAMVAGTTLALAIALPVLGDMLNYEPDVHMRTGSATAYGLTGSGPAIPLPSNLPNIPSTDLLHGGVIAPSAAPEGGRSGLASVLSSAKPWLAWRPSGTGTLTSLTVPAPWGPPGAVTHLAIYLPPDYQTSTARYPVIYEAPFPVTSWEKGVNVASLLDSLIDAGSMPASIAVFAEEEGGPYADSECADSFDGREWFATWMVRTVVPTIDATFRTVASPDARMVMGFSQGGFCSTMLAFRNPTVFGTAISFSGYYIAGVESGVTVNAWRPFNGDATLEARSSPIDLAPQIASAVRARMLVELSAGPTEPFYGPQYRAFARVLDGVGIPIALYPTRYGHAWGAVRMQLPSMLDTWAARMAALEVFGT